MGEGWFERLVKMAMNLVLGASVRRVTDAVYSLVASAIQKFISIFR